jgi:hypothetical protein
MEFSFDDLESRFDVQKETVMGPVFENVHRLIGKERLMGQIRISADPAAMGDLDMNGSSGFQNPVDFGHGGNDVFEMFQDISANDLVNARCLEGQAFFEIPQDIHPRQLDSVAIDIIFFDIFSASDIHGHHGQAFSRLRLHGNSYVGRKSRISSFGRVRDPSAGPARAPQGFLGLLIADGGRLRVFLRYDFDGVFAVAVDVRISERESLATDAGVNDLRLGKAAADQRHDPQSDGRIVFVNEKIKLMIGVPTGRKLPFLLIEIPIRDIEDEVSAELEDAPPVFQRHGRIGHVFQCVRRINEIERRIL